MSVKQLQSKLMKLKDRIAKKKSELATLAGQQKDLQAKISAAKKANPKGKSKTKAKAKK